MAIFFKRSALALLLLATPGGSLARTVVPSAPGGVEKPEIQDLRIAQQALDAFDYDRLWSDRAYAEAMLRHVETVVPIAAHDPSVAAGIAGLSARTYGGGGTAGRSRPRA